MFGSLVNAQNSAGDSSGYPISTEPTVQTASVNGGDQSEFFQFGNGAGHGRTFQTCPFGNPRLSHRSGPGPGVPEQDHPDFELTRCQLRHGVVDEIIEVRPAGGPLPLRVSFPIAAGGLC